MNTGTGSVRQSGFGPMGRNGEESALVFAIGERLVTELTL